MKEHTDTFFGKQGVAYAVEDPDLLLAVENPDLARAKRLICAYCIDAFGADSRPDFSDLRSIGVAYTTLEECEELAVQVNIDLMKPSVNTYIEFSETGKRVLVSSIKYKTMDALCDMLDGMDFDAITSLEDQEWDAFNQSELGKQWLRNTFPNGTRIRLDYMDDIQAPPVGTVGVVQFIDGIGQIHTRWETGSSLALHFGIDGFTKSGEV